MNPLHSSELMSGWLKASVVDLFDTAASGSPLIRKPRMSGAPGDGWEIRREYAETEADARAKMLIYLLENRLISSQDCILQ